ncbi:MAG TPA: hypothetical protein PLB41_05515 [Rubrivivax sp.]|nr:hypothetical protein [Rubrivivax sp.]
MAQRPAARHRGGQGFLMLPGGYSAVLQAQSREQFRDEVVRFAQRLGFQTRHAPAGSWWQLDDIRQDAQDWPLTRGHHLLILMGLDGLELDRVNFEVR